VDILDGEDEASNMSHRVVVPSPWPPEEDRAQAERIGRELIERKGHLSNWVSITAEAIP
jgi:hypothetical protein